MQDSHTSSTFLQTLKPPNFPEHEQLKCPRCESTNTKFCYYNNYNLSQPRHFCKNCRRYWTKGGTLRNIPVGGGTRRNAPRRSSKPKNRQVPYPHDEPIEPEKRPVLSSSKPPLTGSSQNSAPVPEQDPTRMCNYQHPSVDSNRIRRIVVGLDHEPGVSPVSSSSVPLTGSLQNSVPVPVPDSERARMYGLAMNQNRPGRQEASPVQSSSKPLPTSIERNPVRIHDPTRMYNVHNEHTAGEFSSLLESNGQFLKLLQGSGGPGLGLDSVRFSGMGMGGSVFETHSGRVPGANVSDEGQNGDPGCWNGGNGWSDLAIFTPGSGFQ